MSDDELRMLDTQGIFRRVIDPAGIAETVRQFRKAFSREASAAPMLDRVGGRLTPARIQAISELVAAEASGDRGVIAFRSNFLPDGVLQFEEVESWITAHANADGESTQYLTVIGPIESETPISERFVESSRKSLCYATPAHDLVVRIFVTHGGVLDKLRTISESLSKHYGWQPAQATLFVLTAIPPLISTLRYTATRAKFPVLRRIVLTVDPAISPRELAEHYKAVRDEFLAKRYRAMGEKHCTLVLFMFSRPAEETYSVAMAAWNQEHPEWRYKHASNFGKDVLAAKKRLLGSGLDAFATLKGSSPSKGKK